MATDMIEWSRTAATLLRAVAMAHPAGAPAEIKTSADEMWKVAGRGVTLQGIIEAHSKSLERFVTAGGALRAKIVEQPGAEAQIGAYDAAYEKDLNAGREVIAAHVREAQACEKTFEERLARLVEHLRDKPACREVLEELTAARAR